MVSAPSGVENARVVTEGKSPLGDWLVTPLLVFAVVRAGLFFMFYVAVLLVQLDPVPGALYIWDGQWLFDGWLRWDAVGYLVLAEHGYWFDPATGYSSPALLPLFPALVSLVAPLAGGAPAAALLLANAFGAAGLVAVYRLLRERVDKATATRSVILLSVLPYSFLLSAAYPLGLALLLVGLFLLAVERRQWWQAAVCGALAPLAMPACFALWLAMVVASRRAGGWRPLLPLALLPLPALAFAYYLIESPGMPAEMVAATLFGVTASSPLAGGSAGLVLTGPGGTLTVLNLCLALVCLACTPLVVRQCGGAWAVFNAGLALFALVADPVGAGAWLPLALPAVLVVARLLDREIVEFFALAVSGLLLAVVATAFTGWYPFTGNPNAPLNPSEPAQLMARYAAQKTLTGQTLGWNVGGDLLVVEQDAPVERVAPGESLPVTLRIDRLRPTDKNYLLSLHLVDNAGERVAIAQTTLPLEDNRPWFHRLPREIYALGINVAPDTPPGIYEVEASLLIVPQWSTIYEQPTIVDTRGNAVERMILNDVLVAAPDTVMARQEARPPTTLNATLGEDIELLGFGVRMDDNGASREAKVDLYWGARARPEYDYTVFVQALAADGSLLAQDDSYPLAGRFPTTALDPSLAVRDTHRLLLPPSGGPVRVIAGMYRLDTMERLPATVDGVPSGDHVVLGEIDGQ